MSATDWFGYAIAVVSCVLLGWWLHRVNRKPADERIEALAIGFGWFGFAFVLAGKLAGVA